jgi:hypothetical protein
MNRTWLMLWSGLMALAAPASVLAQPDIHQSADGVKAQAVYVVNQGLPAWVPLAFLGVIVVLLALAVSQLSGIKAALEKSGGGKSE